MSRTDLAVPICTSPQRCNELYAVDYNSLAAVAERFREENRLSPAGADAFRVALLAIDVQIDFCHSAGALYVTGAEHDTSRTCSFLLRNADVITDVVPTLDTHTAYQIFHSAFLVDENGHCPPSMTFVSTEDVKTGRWRVNPAAAYAIEKNDHAYESLTEHLLHYVTELERAGKYTLCIWPYHAMLGSVGHALVPTFAEACFVHAIARGAGARPAVKGDHPLTEHYSPFRPEVPTRPDGQPLAPRDAAILATLLDYDAVFICGQAKSHCVAWAIDDLLTHIHARDDSLAGKVYLLEDCTSPVVVPGVADFTDQADAAFDRFRDAGMNVVRSTTPLHEYLPLA